MKSSMSPAGPPSRRCYTYRLRKSPVPSIPARHKGLSAGMASSREWYHCPIASCASRNPGCGTRSKAKSKCPPTRRCKHWRTAGLLGPSWIKPSVFTLAESIIDRQIGMLSAKDASRIPDALALLVAAPLSAVIGIAIGEGSVLKRHATSQPGIRKRHEAGKTLLSHLGFRRTTARVSCPGRWFLWFIFQTTLSKSLGIGEVAGRAEVSKPTLSP
jgi:hypothetical protein